MKRKWKYLLGAFLLAAGLLSGCAQESEQLNQAVEISESQESGNPAAEDPMSGTTQETEEAILEVQELEKRETLVENVETSGTDEESSEASKTPDIPPETGILEDGTYTSKDEVAEYLFLYRHLPDNFITKKEAKALGWVSSEGNLGEVAPGKSIGGDYFGNFEGSLPEKEGREYHECDIDSDGGYRGAKRIVYSNDGLIYYTEDHYETFELLYGEE